MGKEQLAKYLVIDQVITNLVLVIGGGLVSYISRFLAKSDF
jgi:hypothetical protein